MQLTHDPKTQTMIAQVRSNPGRLYSPDPRDALYPMRRMGIARGLPRVLPAKRWRMGKGLTQKFQRGSDCVAHMAAHLRQVTPGSAGTIDVGDGYRWMQDNDEWPGGEPVYYGTSVRAGVEYLRQVDGSVANYFWSQNMDNVLRRLTSPANQGGGPLGVGTDWWSGFDRPDDEGFVEPQGWLRGGHAYVAIEYEPKTAKRKEAIVWLNSHDDNPLFRTTVEVAEYLIFQANGEAVAVVERSARELAAWRKAKAA